MDRRGIEPTLRTFDALLGVLPRMHSSLMTRNLLDAVWCAAAPPGRARGC